MSRRNDWFYDTPRLHVRVLLERHHFTLAGDVLSGLQASPKHLPPKHFYDDRGSQLFERICETEEYYQTRTELRLLESIAPELMATLRPTDLIELGSGAAEKTRTLLDAAEGCRVRCSYVPFDVSEGALRRSAQQLLARYSWLHVHGVVGDYDEHLGLLPQGERRLFVFLGSTIGNFAQEAAIDFLRTLRKFMAPSDHLLLGMDLVKETNVLNRAYNDAQGFTEAFNKNVLLVINRELNGQFDPDAFRHVAFFNEELAQIEMHLQSLGEQLVPIARLGIQVALRDEERILTEISRKFTKKAATDLLGAAGFRACAWHESPGGGFALSLSTPTADADIAPSRP